MKKENIALVSIIVPVYNVEKYLQRCIDSLINQTYKKIEIWLINDGSTDLSGQICEQYKAADNRINVIHKHNGGLSDARNCGLSKITGDYVCFVDSDDWVLNIYVEELLKLSQLHNADIVVCSNCVTTKELGKIPNKKRYTYTIYGKEASLTHLLYLKGISTSAHGKLFKREIIEGITFPTGKLFEDVVPIFHCFEKAQKTVISTRKLYFYFKRADSITKSSYTPKCMDYVIQCNLLYNYVIQTYPSMKNAALSRLIWSEIYIIVHMENYKAYEKEYNEIWQHICKNRKHVICDRNASFKYRGICVLSYLGSWFLRFIFNIMQS